MVRDRPWRIIFALAWLGCSSEQSARPQRDQDAALPVAGPGVQDATIPRACEPERGLLRVVDALADDDEPCRAWIASTFGRAVRVAGGSGSVWSRRTEHGTGLMLTATHVWSRCTSSDAAPRDPSGNCPQALVEPRAGINAARLTEAAGVYASRSTSIFELYNGFVPGPVIGTPDLLPRHEISLFVVDGPTYEPWDRSVPLRPVRGLVALHDPQQLTLAPQTWDEPIVGARVLALGYPLDNAQSDLVAGVGRVLSDPEVAEAQTYLRERGDEEGDVPYEPAVEFFYRGVGRSGMSGSGVFDEAGRQVGMVVRGSLLENGPHYVRAVRMSYVVESVQSARLALSAEQRALVDPYLEDTP